MIWDWQVTHTRTLYSGYLLVNSQRRGATGTQTAGDCIELCVCLRLLISTRTYHFNPPPNPRVARIFNASNTVYMDQTKPTYLFRERP
jgi:hypothetical protein